MRPIDILAGLLAAAVTLIALMVGGLYVTARGGTKNASNPSPCTFNLPAGYYYVEKDKEPARVNIGIEARLLSCPMNGECKVIGSTYHEATFIPGEEED